MFAYIFIYSCLRQLMDEAPVMSRVVAPTCGIRKSLILPREAFDVA